MAPNDHSFSDRAPATTYRIEIRGPLPSQFAQSLEGFDVQTGPNSTITGPISDTAALYGLIARLEALGLILDGAQRIDAAGDNADAPT